ncbi:MAG: hypothetical protein ABJN22_08430 [Litorimonas sp.]
MTMKNSLKLTLCAGAMLVLAACATTSTTQETVYEAPKNQKEAAMVAAEELSATKNVTKSADGEVVCKRQAVVGSNFKRKVCLTQDQWDAEAAASQKTTGDIQRRKGPGVTN